MGLVIVGIMVVLVVAAAALGMVRRGSGGADIPASIVAWAARLLPADRAPWGQAMAGELAQHQGRGRWRFAFGCVRAALGLPGHGRARWVVASVLGAAIVSAALVGYGFVRYPGIAAGTGTWIALASFGLVLLAFVIVAGVLARDPRAGVFGLMAGCVTAGVWVAAGLVAASAHRKGSVFLLLALPVASIVVGVVGARRGRSRTVGWQAAGVSAVVGALAVFLVLVTDTMVTGGRPYDAGQLQDFATSGYPDLSSYAVSDNLGTAMVVLLFMAVMNGVFGSVGAALVPRHGA